MEFKAQGNKLYSQGKTQDAVRAYTQGLDLVEEGGGEGATAEDRGCLHLLYSNRSMAHLDLCLVDEALQDAECAIDANPEYGKAYARRAAVMVDLWNFKEALQDLDKAEELDPSLTESLAELRLRAQGKKWVPNCYLQKQMEMRKKHKCDYVAMFELESGEEIVEPVSFLRRTEDKTSALAIIQDARPVFRALILTGDGGSQSKFLLSNIGFALSDKVKQGKAVPSHCQVDYTTRQKMLKVQLRREFGPTTDEMSLPDGETAGILRLPIDKKTVGIPLESRYFLFQAVNQFSLSRYADAVRLNAETVNTTTPILFPGRPKWLEEEEARLATMRAAQRVTGEILQPQDFEAGTRAVKAHRARHLQRDGKCHGCAKVLTDPDPQECLCGQQYCSYMCHLDGWDSHQRECNNILDKGCQTVGRGPEEAIFYLTYVNMLYWTTVLEGELPCKAEPDVVALWKERNITFEEQGEAVFMREIAFYREHEMEAMNTTDDCVLLNDEDCFNFHEVADPRLLHVARHDFFGRWRERMSKPLVTDSCARIVAKHLLYEIISTIYQKVAVSGNFGLNCNELLNLFVAHLLEHRSDDPLLKNALIYFDKRLYLQQ